MPDFRLRQTKRDTAGEERVNGNNVEKEGITAQPFLFVAPSLLSHSGQNRKKRVSFRVTVGPTEITQIDIVNSSSAWECNNTNSRHCYA